MSSETCKTGRAQSDDTKAAEAALVSPSQLDEPKNGETSETSMRSKDDQSEADSVDHSQAHPPTPSAESELDSFWSPIP